MKSDSHWVQNPLFLSLIFNSIWMKIYGTIILPAILYGCETWSLTLREERRLRAFENRVLRTILWPKRDEIRGSGENYIMRSLLICTPNQILFGWSNREEWDGRGTQHVWVRAEVYTGFWWGYLRERRHLEDPGVDGRIKIKMDLQEVGRAGMNWIHLAPDRDRWRALVNAVMNLRAL